MLTTCTSAPPGSIRRATVAVRTVFCCVASRKRERTASGQPTGGTLQRKAQPSRAERHRSQPWGGGWPERLFESQLFNLTPGCKPSTEKVRPVAPLRTGLLLENRDLRSRAPPPPPAEGATSLLLRRLRGLLRKRTSPDGHCPRAWEILPFQLIVETEYFPFKAGRAGFISVARGDFISIVLSHNE